MAVNGLNEQKTSQILRIMRRMHLKSSSVISELAKCDTNKLNALLKVKKISTEIVSFAIRFDDTPTLERIVKLLNNRFSLCQEVIEVAHDEKKCEILCLARDYVSFYDIFEVFDPMLDSEQYEEILKGYQRGIYEKRIRYFANARFSAKQMCEIRKAFRNGLPDEYVVFIAESGLPAECMREMRKGIEHGLSKFETEIYARDCFSASQMHQIRRIIEQKFNMRFACFMANPNFSEEQMELIREGFESGLSIEDVESYIYLPQEQLKEKMFALQEAELKKYILS